jgi:iron complex transport system substrate-binding protein
MSEIVFPLLIALVLDWMLGDPVWLPHPIVWFGKMIAFCEHRLNKGNHRKLKGAFVAVGLIVLVYAVTSFLIYSFSFLILRPEGLSEQSSSPQSSFLISALLIFFCLAGTTLIREVKAVFLAVDRSLDEGRMQVARIVGRDTSELSAQEVRRAALETLAENLSDGVIAPLFWLALLGVPGMMAYKMVNTLDSMIGYRTERYRDFGCWAAHIDDIANYIPARLTALLMIITQKIPFFDRGQSDFVERSLCKFVWRYGRQHASPNSGYPEAALAGILNCRFGGPHYYFGELFDKPYIGDNERKLTTADMKKSIQVNRMTEILMVGLVVLMSLVMGGCTSKKSQSAADDSSLSTLSSSLSIKYATGFTVRDSAGVRLVEVGDNYHFALVAAEKTSVPEGYTKVKVPIKSTICMTALQLSNFTILDAHDVVKGLTGTKNLFNKDIRQRVKDGRIVKIGMEGNFDTEMVLAANPDVIFISPFKRGGYEAIKETGITLVPHLGYKELDPLGQAEWIKFIGLFIGKEREANEIFAGIEKRYNDLKLKIQESNYKTLPTVTSGEMHYGTWRAVGGKNYLAQIFRDAGADYVIKDDETAGENVEFEKMYELSAHADYWRILNSYPGDFSYEALKASEPRNELFKAFKERKVIYCNMKQTPYYEISPVQPDVLLKDLVAIFHSELVEKDYQPTYYRLLDK